MRMNQYLKEIKYLKSYILFIVSIIISIYTICIFLDEGTVINLCREDHFFEWLTALSFLIGSVFFLLIFIKTRNIFFILLCLILFIGFGEEIAWGQRLLDFKTPELMEKINIQREFTLHNIEIFNSHDSNHHYKTGLGRLLTVNFLASAFFVAFSFILPFCVYHMKIVRSITMKIKLPVPPISIGVYFVLNWLLIHILLDYILPAGKTNSYYASFGELSECIESIIWVAIGFYFYTERKNIILGKDIKEII
jgi:hypothetical protein